jgi:hypothetical protein
MTNPIEDLRALVIHHAIFPIDGFAREVVSVAWPPHMAGNLDRGVWASAASA